MSCTECSYGSELWREDSSDQLDFCDEPPSGLPLRNPCCPWRRLPWQAIKAKEEGDDPSGPREHGVAGSVFTLRNR